MGTHCGGQNPTAKLAARFGEEGGFSTTRGEDEGKTGEMAVGVLANKMTHLVGLKYHGVAGRGQGQRGTTWAPERRACTNLACGWDEVAAL